jgi:branched-chain amino acid transport system substrate-binding protein
VTTTVRYSARDLRAGDQHRRRSTATYLSAFLASVLLAAGGSWSANSNTRSGTATAPDQTGALSRNISSTESNNSDASEGVTRTSITVGGVLTASNAGGFTEIDADMGAKAYFQLVNSEGGVYGRKIKYLGARDDGFSSATDVQIVRSLVESDHVFAVVPVNSISFTGGQYAAQNDVPFVGLGTSPPFCNTHSGFGVSGCTSPGLTPGTPISGILGKELLELIRMVFGKVRNNTVALAFDSSENGSVAAKSFPAGVKAGGMKVAKVVSGIPAQGASDFSPFVRALVTADNGGPPGAVILANGGSNVDSIRAGLRAARYKGVVVDAVSYGPQTISNPATRALLNGSYTFIPFTAYQDNTPAVLEMRTAFAKVAGPSFHTDEWGMYGYWAAAEFVVMLKRVGPDLSRPRFLRAINSGFTYSLPGLFGETQWPGAHHGQPDSCDSIVTLDRTRWVTVIPLQCERAVPYGTLSRS